MKKTALLIVLLSLAACTSRDEKALEEKNAAVGLCEEKVNQLVFKNRVEYQECLNNAGTKYFQDIHSPFMDLVYLEHAYYIKLAKQVDKGQLSIEDAKIKAAEYHNYIYHEAAQRTYPLPPSQSNNNNNSYSTANPVTSSDPSQQVYSPSECIGAIVNGECHGSILPNSAYHQTCHGEMLNGQCTGPMF